MTKRRHGRQSQQVEGNEWFRRLERISLAVDVWRKRAENPTSPEPRSSLAADSVEGLNVENPIWYWMCISSEHLDFAIDAMRLDRNEIVRDSLGGYEHECCAFCGH